MDWVLLHLIVAMYLLSTVTASTTATSSTVIKATTSTIDIKRDCPPTPVNITISDDTPINTNKSFEIDCLIWTSVEYTKLSYRLVNEFRATFKLHSYFNRTTGRNDLHLIVNRVLRGQNTTYQTTIAMTLRDSNETQIQPININVTEVNDRPRIIGPVFLDFDEGFKPVLLQQNKNLTIIDEDIGNTKTPPEWTDFTLTSDDIPPEFKIEKRDASHFIIKIVKPIDADAHGHDPLERGENEFEPVYFLSENDLTSSIDYSDYSDYENIMAPLLQVQSNVFRFTVNVKDGGGLSSTAVIRIRINDVNDNPPVCVPPPSVLVSNVPDGNIFETNAVYLTKWCHDADYRMINRQLDFRLLDAQECEGAFEVTRYGLRWNRVGFLLTRNKTKCPLSMIVFDSKYSTTFKLDVVFKTCTPGFDDTGRYWNHSKPGYFSFQMCPTGYEGRIKRFCDEHALYQPTEYAFVSKAIASLSAQVKRNQYNVTETLRILTNLTTVANASNTTLFSGEILAVKDILSIIVYTAPTLKKAQERNDFIQVVDNLLSENNTREWQTIINTTGAGAEDILNSVDRFVAKITNTPNNLSTDIEFSKANLHLKIGSTTNCSDGIFFPDKNNTQTWLKTTKNSVQLSCNQDANYSSYSSAMYRNLSKMIPSKYEGNGSTQQDSINAAVMSFTYFPLKQGQQLKTPVTVTFQVFSKQLILPRCSYLKPYSLMSTANSDKIIKLARRYGTRGQWATDGCWLHSYTATDGIVVCKCNHLTNFAVLMSPASTGTKHHTALSVISLVGCIVSMLCLFVTVFAYIFYWKFVRSGRSVILVNLCVALFLAYLLFLAGVDKTSNTGTCTAIAVLLHLVYLVVFFLMLVEGVDVALAILKPLIRKNVTKWLLIAAYVTAVVVVGISMGASQLEGYGNKRFCWLTFDSGLIWAFICPVIVVVLVNIAIIVLVVRQMFSTVAMAKKTTKEKAKTGLRSLCVLMPVMGVTWLFGVFSINEDAVVFQYLFAIFNSLQGVFIFVFHCLLNRKMKESFMRTKAKFIKSEISQTELSRSGGKTQPTKSSDAGDL